jgi:hypothetical protein
VTLRCKHTECVERHSLTPRVVPENDAPAPPSSQCLLGQPLR